MPRWCRSLSVYVAVITLAFGCEAKPEPDEGADESSGDGDGDGDGDGGPADSDGPPTPMDYEELCIEQLDRDTCEAIPTEQYASQGVVSNCVWSVEAPVMLEADACMFGPATASCRVSTSGDLGCPVPTLACGVVENGWSRMDGDQVIIGRASTCYVDSGEDCEVSSEGLVLSGVPECACLCDAGFPGS
jgi:hypothetical protein